MNIRLIIKISFNYFLSAFLLSLSILSMNLYADILFNAKIYGPTSNIFSTPENGETTKLTTGNNWKDREFDFSSTYGLVFSSNRHDDAKPSLNPSPYQFNIFLSANKNQPTEQLTFGPERKISPKFNQTGKQDKIAYLKIIDKTKTELRLYDLTNKKDTLMTSDYKIYDFSWSPTENTILLSTSDKDNTYIRSLNIENRAIENIISKKIDIPHNATPKTSKKLIIPEKENVFLVSPTWSPNGKNFAYISHPLNQGYFKNLYTFDLKSKKSTQISTGNIHVQSPIAWSSDSQSIIYSALKGYKFYYDETLRDRVYEGGMHIFISTMDGKMQQLTKGDHFFGRPIFSPDNNRIAFLYSDQLGDSNKLALKTMDKNGLNITELYKRVDRESFLLWADTTTDENQKPNQNMNKKIEK